MDIKTVIKNDPMLSRRRCFMILFGGFTALYVIVGVMNLVTWLSGQPFTPSSLIVGPVWFLNGLLYFLQYRFWRRIVEKRYVAMMLGQGRLMQPVPDSLMRSLPRSLGVRQRPRVLVILGVIFLLILIIPGLILLSPFGRNMDLLPFILFPLLVAVVIVVIFVFRTRFVAHIELFPEGIRTYFEGRAYSIRWQDIRVFARYRNIVPLNLQGRKSKPRFIYELSGISGTGEMIVAYWQLPSYQWVNIAPLMTAEQYEQYPEQLATLITARTGLSLLDFDVQEDDSASVFHVK